MFSDRQRQRVLPSGARKKRRNREGALSGHVLKVNDVFCAAAASCASAARVLLSSPLYEGRKGSGSAKKARLAERFGGMKISISRRQYLGSMAAAT